MRTVNKIFLALITIIAFTTHAPLIFSQQEEGLPTALDMELFDLVSIDHFNAHTVKFDGMKIYVIDKTNPSESLEVDDINGGFEWGKMPLPPEEIIKSLLSRNSSSVSLKMFKPTHDHVVVGNSPSYDWEFIHKNDVIGFYLPGYSNDGKTAIVCFYYSMSPHAVLASYILEREEASWKIVKRAFYWHP